MKMLCLVYVEIFEYKNEWNMPVKLSKMSSHLFLLCVIQHNIQPDSLSQDCSITNSQLLCTDDKDEGQMDINQDRAAIVQPVSYSTGDSLLKLTIKESQWILSPINSQPLHIRSRSHTLLSVLYQHIIWQLMYKWEDKMLHDS